MWIVDECNVTVHLEIERKIIDDSESTVITAAEVDLAQSINFWPVLSGYTHLAVP
jgi:hypothetical protein